jgi:hypothetical protein
MKLGDKIGRGKWRVVYAHPNDTSLIIKVSDRVSLDRFVIKPNGDENPNLHEWLVWNTYKSTDVGKLLCPCISISDCSQFLIMKRADPVSKNTIDEAQYNYASGMLGSIGLSDFGIPNFGVLDQRLVMIDYGNIGRDLMIKLKSQ